MSGYTEKLSSLWKSALWGASTAQVVNSLGTLNASNTNTSSGALLNNAGVTTTSVANNMTVVAPSNPVTSVARNGQVCNFVLSGAGVISGATNFAVTVKQAGWKPITLGSAPDDGTMTYDNNVANRVAGVGAKMRWNGVCWSIERTGNGRLPALS